MDEIRTTHPYGFRSGKWARLLGRGSDGPRDLYHVRFPDGVTDWWVVNDPDGAYEFRVEGTEPT